MATQSFSVRLSVGTRGRTFALSPAITSWLRVTVTGVVGGWARSQGVLKVAIPGLRVEQGLKVPDDADPDAGPPLFISRAQPVCPPCAIRPGLHPGGGGGYR